MTENGYISVTGGTGHLGRVLIMNLLERGKYVKALIRSKDKPFEHPRLSWIEGDLNNAGALEALTDQSEVVIHCASAISLGEIDQNLVFDVNVTGTSNLIDSCLDKPLRFVFISSSTAVKEGLSDEIIDEKRDYKTDTKFYYAWTKAIAEQRVLDAVVHNRLDAFIIRPTAIVGPPDLGPSRFGRTILDLNKGQLPFITNGGYNMVDVRDLAQTIFNSISKGKKGNIYLVGGSYTSLEALAQLARAPKSPLKIPVNLLLFILPLIRIYDTLFPLKWPVNRESLVTLKFSSAKMDFSKAIRELAHEPRPIQVTIKDLISWFHQNKIK